MNDQDIVILEGARTPFGKFLGRLRNETPTQLATVAAKAALTRSQVLPDWIDAVCVGNVLPSSGDTPYLPRHTALNLSIPPSTPALAVNRLCGSGLEAIIQGAQFLQQGEATFVLAGGSENMSMTPYALRGVREGWKFKKTAVDDILHSALFDAYAGCQIAETVEYLAKEYNISRQEADEWSLHSQRLTLQAYEQQRMQKEIVSYEFSVGKNGKGKAAALDQDEALAFHLTSDFSLNQLSQLPPLHGPEGILTAGNATGLNDGSAMLVMTSGRQAKEKGLRPLGRVLGWARVGVAPKLMGTGPVIATRKVLQQLQMQISDIDVMEINDSFAVQYLVVEKELQLRRERVNLQGGALTLGHPLGATGTRLVLSALYQLRSLKKELSLISLCIGGGQGMSMVVEGLDV